MVKFNDYYNEQRCMTRLLDDFLKHGNLVIAVTHAVQFEGILKVSKVFDKVFITNSHTHWTYLPDNVEMWDYESYLCI